MTLPTIDFLGYPVINLGQKNIDKLIKYFLSFSTPSLFTVINANKLFLADKHTRLKKIMQNSDALLPEQAVVIGSRWLGTPLAGRISGIEFMEYVLEHAEERGYTIFLYGAKEEVGQRLIEKYRHKFPKIKILDYVHGFFADNNILLERINRAQPDFLFVALGSPKQEYWMEENRHKINAKIMVGVGGSFDVLSGVKKRAPAWTQHGFEWLYRALQDWHRLDLWKRYLITNPYFVYRVLQYKFSGRSV